MIRGNVADFDTPQNPACIDDSSPKEVCPWLIWQLIDSAFPVGAFVHSGGLESAVQLGQVRDPQDVATYISTSLRSNATLFGPVIVKVLQSPDQYIEIDAFLDVSFRNPIPNQASRSQGQAFLYTAYEIWSDPFLLQAKKRLQNKQWYGHLPISFGLVCKVLQMDVIKTVDAFLFCQMRGMISAAVRLGVIGSRQAQKVQNKLSIHRDQWLSISLQTPFEDIAQTAPLIEILQAQHEKLFSRIFVS
ncbi:MAG: urease accessory protein UreF [Phycisphaerae bacterium]|nr:MAG: urease accessory protein UreF [Phycisphaerae bacterium]